VRLPAELALGADLARDPGHLRGELVELVGHAVEDRGDLVHQRVAGGREPSAEVAAADSGETGKKLLKGRSVEPGPLVNVCHRCSPILACGGEIVRTDCYTIAACLRADAAKLAL
jgi:hypothetical protein